MKLKKTAAFVAAITLCAALLAACGNNEGANDETTAGTAAETTSAATTASDVPAVTDDSTADAEDTSAAEDEEAASPLQTAAETAIDGNDWPAMTAVSNSEKDYIADFFLLDTENANYKDLLVMQCPMSANMSELIIIDADDVSSAKADLEARQKKAKEQDAFYPDDVERAGASIVGTEGSYAYFILGNNSDKVETALVEALKN